MDVDAFVAAHEPEWRRLDELVKRRRRLTGPEIDELVALYQRTTTHLSAVQAAAHDPVLAAGLSSRVARARAAVTGAHAADWGVVGRFVLVSFPAMAYRARWWWLATAAGSLAAALVMGWWLARSPALQAALLPASAVRQLVNHRFQGYYSQYAAPAFAAQVWTHNVWAAALALIFGIALGLPTLLILFENAANIGVDGALMITHGRGVLFFALITPHGMLELSAVFLAEEGRAAVTIALGLVVVLLVSGAIEAFVTPSPLPTWARIAIGGVAEAAFLAYVLVLGRRAVAAGLTADIAEAPDTAPVSG